MSKFKVGDKVKRISGGSHFGQNEGATGVVRTYVNDSHMTLEGYSSDICFNPGYYELVESELERLVRVANEGMRALNELWQHRNELETYDTNKKEVIPPNSPADWVPIAGNVVMGWATGTYQIRIPPKPKFEPFYVGRSGSQWLVELKGDRLHIGCKEFDASDFRKQMTALFKETDNDLLFDTGKNSATTVESHRSGPKFFFRAGETYSLSWSDCDRIVAALEKAGVK